MQLTKDTPTLSTYMGYPHGSLMLTPTTSDDLCTIFEFLCLEPVYRFLGGQSIREVTTPDEFVRMHCQFPKPAGGRSWSIRLSDNTMIGEMTVVCREDGNAFWQSSLIGPEELRGRGLGTVAKRLLLSHLFESGCYERVVTRVHPDNQASRAFNFRAGAVAEDDWRMVITKEAWLRACHTS